MLSKPYKHCHYYLHRFGNIRKQLVPRIDSQITTDIEGMLCSDLGRFGADSCPEYTPKYLQLLLVYSAVIWKCSGSISAPNTLPNTCSSCWYILQLFGSVRGRLVPRIHSRIPAATAGIFCSYLEVFGVD
jgi:hypothetical protein